MTNPLIKKVIESEVGANQALLAYVFHLSSQEAKEFFNSLEDDLKHISENGKYDQAVYFFLQVVSWLKLYKTDPNVDDIEKITRLAQRDFDIVCTLNFMELTHEGLDISRNLSTVTGYTYQTGRRGRITKYVTPDEVRQFELKKRKRAVHSDTRMSDFSQLQPGLAWAIQVSVLTNRQAKYDFNSMIDKEFKRHEDIALKNWDVQILYIIFLFLYAIPSEYESINYWPRFTRNSKEFIQLCCCEQITALIPLITSDSSLAMNHKVILLLTIARLNLESLQTSSAHLISYLKDALSACLAVEVKEKVHKLLFLVATQISFDTRKDFLRLISSSPMPLYVKLKSLSEFFNHQLKNQYTTEQLSLFHDIVSNLLFEILNTDCSELNNQAKSYIHFTRKIISLFKPLDGVTKIEGSLNRLDEKSPEFVIGQLILAEAYYNTSIKGNFEAAIPYYQQAYQGLSYCWLYLLNTYEFRIYNNLYQERLLKYHSRINGWAIAQQKKANQYIDVVNCCYDFLISHRTIFEKENDAMIWCEKVQVFLENRDTESVALIIKAIYAMSFIASIHRWYLMRELFSQCQSSTPDIVMVLINYANDLLATVQNNNDFNRLILLLTKTASNPLFASIAYYLLNHLDQRVKQVTQVFSKPTGDLSCNIWNNPKSDVHLSPEIQSNCTKFLTTLKSNLGRNKILLAVKTKP